MEDQIQVFDLHRMFIGDIGIAFLLEVAFRTSFMFIFTVVLVRLLGKRGMGQLAPFELVIIIALGSAVGDPMLYPDVPLAHAMVVVAIIVSFQRALIRLTDRNEVVERFIESEPALFVRDGVVQLDLLRREHFGRNELFETLREEGVEQLGQVRRAYLEPSGRVSVWLYERDSMKNGLPLLPTSDPDCVDPGLPGSHADVTGDYACYACGNLRDVAAGETFTACNACGCAEGWVPAQDAEDTGGSGADDSSRRRRGRFLS